MRGNKDNSDQGSVSNHQPHHHQQHQGHVPHYSYNPSGHHNQYNNSRMSSTDKENPRPTRGSGRGGNRGGMRGSGPRGGPGGSQDDYGAMQTNASNSGSAAGTGNRGTGLLGGPPTHYHRGHQSSYSGGGQRGAGGGHSSGERGHHNHNHSGQENIGSHQAGSNRGGAATNAAATTTEVKQPPPEFNMKTNDFPALPGVSPSAVGVASIGKHKTAAALTAEQEEQRTAFLEVVKGTGKVKLDSESGDNPAGAGDHTAAEDSSHSEAHNHR